VVLLDLNLPDMSGYEVAALVRENKDWSSVVLVALTGFGSEVHPLRAEISGIDAYFRKPMDFGALGQLHRRSA
jgi:DNA-binding response OmpR family regulator